MAAGYGSNNRVLVHIFEYVHTYNEYVSVSISNIRAYEYVRFGWKTDFQIFRNPRGQRDVPIPVLSLHRESVHLIETMHT
jgi:hypothetical protein